MKIAVYTIALNEISNVERYLASCADADTIVIADTGSTDGTREALQRGGAVTHSISVRPWRYDAARNAALALVPPDIDICFVVDLDEILAPGWRQAIESHWTERTTLGRYRYVYSHLPNGAPAVVFRGARMHVRFGAVNWSYSRPSSGHCLGTRSSTRNTGRGRDRASRSMPI